jgi:cytochrome c5
MKQYFLLSSLLGLSLLFSSCYYDNGEALGALLKDDCTPTSVSYLNEVVPILQANCYVCHTGPSPSGGVVMGSHANDLVIAQDGRLLGVIRHEAGYSAMPPAGDKLADCNITTIAAWISEGAQNN